MRFFDTNALINADLSKEDTFWVSSVSLQELEQIKTNKNKSEDIRFKVRQTTHWLDKNEDKFNVVIYDNKQEELIKSVGIEITPDSKICAGAAVCPQKCIVFVTDDISCKNIARKIFGLNVVSLGDQEERIYKGYRRLRGNSTYINEQMESMDLSSWNINEYLIIENTDDSTEREMRFDGEKFVALKLPPSKHIKGRNALQRCALDLLNNPDVTICAIQGGFGSGKTALTMKSALYQVLEKGNQAQINIIREPLGEGLSVGYLKGTFEEKTDQFFLPLVQQLDGGEFELESLKQRGIVEAHIPYYCKGLTFNDSITVVDEAEDLDAKQIRLIGTRLGENSRIFFNGDYKQSVYMASEQNALIRLCNSLKGNPMFGTIYLEEDVRSTTSKLFAHIFE